MIQEIALKFGNMRKSEAFTVFPRPTNVGPEYTRITMKSDHREIVVDTTDGKALLSVYAANYPMLAKGVAAGFVVPAEIIEQIKAAQPKSGDMIGPGCYVA